MLRYKKQNGTREPSIKLETLVVDIGRQFGRDKEEIEGIINTFKANWLTDVAHWYPYFSMHVYALTCLQDCVV